MEINGNTLKSGSNSSNEDLSQYTDADESMSAPTEILAEVNIRYLINYEIFHPIIQEISYYC